MHHYDLLARPDWKARSVLVVSPFVERKFFERIIEDLRPAVLTVVIDDGCRADDVSMVRGLANNRTKVRVVPGGARGLVHAKIFHVAWLTACGRRAHTLVYGSGNATRQAFDGGINSELMCKVRLTKRNHAAILQWTKQVRSAASASVHADRVIVPVRDAWLADGVRIRLPSMTIKDAESKASNFHLWLQRGRLASTFRPDPSFLRVQVKLLAEIPPGDVERSVKNIGFEIPRTQRLLVPYLPIIEGEGENDGGGHWRSRFFAWTQLGDWCSDACLRKNEHLFRKSGHAARIKNLRLLEELSDPGPRETARSLFLDRVVRLWAAFGDHATSYLEAVEGELNTDFYLKVFAKRLERDLELAADEEFTKRYVNGCEFIDVPRFRMDAIAWKSFVVSFTSQIHLEWMKTLSHSLILKSVQYALGDGGDKVLDDPKKLAKLLLFSWNEIIKGDDGEEISVGEYIDRYHV